MIIDKPQIIHRTYDARLEDSSGHCQTVGELGFLP